MLFFESALDSTNKMMTFLTLYKMSGQHKVSTYVCKSPHSGQHSWFPLFPEFPEPSFSLLPSLADFLFPSPELYLFIPSFEAKYAGIFVKVLKEALHRI